MNSPTNLAAFRISHAEKSATLRGETRRIDTRPSKVAAAIKWLGKRYVCAPCNRVTKLDEPLPENFLWQPRTLRRPK